VPRRRFLQGGAALAAGALLPGCEALPKTAAASAHRIDIHHHLLHNRRNAASQKPAKGEQLLWKAFSFLMKRPALYRFATKFAPLGGLLHPLVQGTPLDPVASWTATREFPAAPMGSFRERFRAHAAAKKSAGNKGGNR
jgi:L-lactate dehydrogenase complex protein LldF